MYRDERSTSYESFALAPYHPQVISCCPAVGASNVLGNFRQTSPHGAETSLQIKPKTFLSDAECACREHRVLRRASHSRISRILWQSSRTFI